MDPKEVGLGGISLIPYESHQSANLARGRSRSLPLFAVAELQADSQLCTGRFDVIFIGFS